MYDVYSVYSTDVYQSSSKSGSLLCVHSGIFCML